MIVSTTFHAIRWRPFRVVWRGDPTKALPTVVPITIALPALDILRRGAVLVVRTLVSEMMWRRADPAVPTICDPFGRGVDNRL